MTPRTQLQKETTYRVLRMLQANPDLTQSDSPGSWVRAPL